MSKTLTERIFAMNIIKTGREARLLINSGRVCVNDCTVTNEDYLVSDTEEVVIKPVKRFHNEP
jgi:ribosomal protein S4